MQVDDTMVTDSIAEHTREKLALPTCNLKPSDFLTTSRVFVIGALIFNGIPTLNRKNIDILWVKILIYKFYFQYKQNHQKMTAYTLITHARFY